MIVLHLRTNRGKSTIKMQFLFGLVFLAVIKKHCSTYSGVNELSHNIDLVRNTLHVHSGVNAGLYNIDSLKNPGDLYPLGGQLPSTRIYNSLALVGNYLIVYGGYFSDGSLLDDVNLFDIRSEKWSGPILKPQCCNDVGKIVETIGYSAQMPLNAARIGFEGDLPLARAEHGACGANNLMYIFGGVTELYGYSHDLYTFDPYELHWAVVDSNFGQVPEKRAGHAMIANGEEGLIVFGGRGSAGGMLVAFNDVYQYSTRLNEWTFLNAVSTVAPAPRQYVAAAIMNSNLFIFGGVDPASNTTFNCLWAFNLGSQQWRQILPNTGGTVGFAPPPLFGAHLIPVSSSRIWPPTVLSSNSKKNGTDKITVTTPSASTLTFLVYGGVGGGGACGSPQCSFVETALGQVYNLAVDMTVFASPRVTPTGAQPPPTGRFSTYASEAAGATWNYARLTSSLSDRGRLVKRYALEQVVYAADRRVLYEFGGVRSRYIAPSLYSQVMKEVQPQSNVYGGQNIVATENTVLEAGGAIPFVLWDVATGENLRSSMSIPTNRPWIFQQAFANFQPAGNSSSMEFCHDFRFFSVAPSDVVLVTVQSEPAIASV